VSFVEEPKHPDGSRKGESNGGIGVRRRHTDTPGKGGRSKKGRELIRGVG